jgi:hypothetical protein
MHCARAQDEVARARVEQLHQVRQPLHYVGAQRGQLYKKKIKRKRKMRRKLGGRSVRRSISSS